jgi:ribosome hibernation promoting factor
MKTLISIPHHEYPSAIRERVAHKLQHLARYFDRIVSIRALLERQGELHRVELVANVGHGPTLVVDARGPGLDAALDDAQDRMARVLRRHKDRLDDRHRRTGRSGRA